MNLKAEKAKVLQHPGATNIPWIRQDEANLLVQRAKRAAFVGDGRTPYLGTHFIHHP
jgi:hypothetical protein